MNRLLDNETKSNIDEVRYRIALKMNSNFPYYATKECTKSIITDMDHFPYRRFYRGEYQSTEPIIVEREAGYRNRKDEKYIQLVDPVIYRPEYCWQYPCTSIKPCKPEGEQKKKQKQEQEDDKAVEKREEKCIKNYVIAP